jgi:hypothetical protein
MKLSKPGGGGGGREWSRIYIEGKGLKVSRYTILLLSFHLAACIHIEDKG